MKPQTPEEILKNDKNNNWFFSDESLKNSLIEVMKEHTRQAIKYALEDAENNGEVDDYSGAKAFIKKSSILSRYESILKELGL